MASQERLSAFCSLFKAHVVAQRLNRVLNQLWFEGLCSTQLSLVKGNAWERLRFVCQYLKAQLGSCSHLFRFFQMLMMELAARVIVT